MRSERDRRRATKPITTRTRTGSDRAQTSLVAVAVALLTLTVVTGLALAMADGALTSAERDAGERRVATSLAARFVAADSPVTTRANALDQGSLEALDGRRLERQFPVVEREAATVRVNGSTVATTGSTPRGTTIRRLVVVERRQTRTLTPSFGRRQALTLPRRAGEVTLRIDPPADSAVRTVRADDRVVLHDPGGLRGTFTVDLSRYETTRLRFAGDGPLPGGSVEIRYAPPETTKTTLAVTVDA